MNKRRLTYRILLCLSALVVCLTGAATIAALFEPSVGDEYGNELVATALWIAGATACSFIGSLLLPRPDRRWLGELCIGTSAVTAATAIVALWTPLDRVLGVDGVVQQTLRACALGVLMVTAITLLSSRRRRRDRFAVTAVFRLSVVAICLAGLGAIIHTVMGKSSPEWLRDATLTATIVGGMLVLLTSIFRGLQKTTDRPVTGLPLTEAFDIPGCPICAGMGADERLMRVEIWSDDYWRLTASLVAEIPGFCYLEPRRHIPDLASLDGDEAEQFGAVVAKVTAALKQATGAERVYVYVFGGTIPHLHLHLAPHRAGDALNEEMIKGEKTMIKLESGIELMTSRTYPPLSERELRAAAQKIQAALGR